MSDLAARFKKLSDLSISRHSVAFTNFEWPDIIPDNVWWQSPDLLTTSFTDFHDQLDISQLMTLSKWECINSFSLNYTGELELIQEISRVFDKISFNEAREYLFHLIDEENQHMWYFHKFCNTYGGKVYPNKKFQIEKIQLTPAQEQFLIFARILIFEEIGHYYNVQNSRDMRVHPFIREINEEHYKDESRHIAYGFHILEHLAPAAIADEGGAEFLGQQLDKSITINIGSLYNSRAYRDSGISNGMQFRASLMSDPGRINFHENKLLSSIKRLFKRLNIPLNGNS